MTIQHNTISDPEIHEPKGISTAVADKVYMSDGSQSGSWVYPPCKPHAELYITSGTTNLSLNGTANTYIDYNPSTEWTSSGNEDILTVTASNGEVNLILAGHYYIDFWTNFTTSSVAAGTQYKFKFAIDGTEQSRTVTIEKHTSGADLLHVSASGTIAATANQKLSISVAGDATSAGEIITPTEAGLTVLFLD